jgi:heme/copper-type cytochrome/quinol oxidase subunit 1
MPPSRPILSNKRVVRTNFGSSESDKYFFARIHAGEFDLWTFPLRVAVAAVIFVIVFSLLAYAVVKFRNRGDDDGSEPPQVYGSNQVELAWTVIPVLIVVTLFMATARVIAGIQNVSRSDTAVDVVAIGHQFWWEYRYPALKVVTANELHVPVSDRDHPTPTFIKLLSADTNHSFWVPRLAARTDLIPNAIKVFNQMFTMHGTYEPGRGWDAWNLLCTIGVFFQGAGIVVFVGKLLWSYLKGPSAEGESVGRLDT